jgi:protein TonB
VTLPAPSVVERALEAAAWEQPAAPPRPLAFEIVAVERIVPQPQPQPQPAPEPVAAPEPPPAEVEVRIEGPTPEPAVDVPVAFDTPPVPLRERVPDLEARVEAALRAGAGKPRPRRRAPLAVPRFTPLAREPWEDRLDAVLSH